MRKKRHTIFFAFCAIAAIAGCRQSYEPSVIKANKNYLVVEGLINGGARSVTTITLSRTRNVTDSIVYAPELHAQVRILQKSGNVFLLHEQGNGVYASDALTLNTADTYQLQITTAGNGNYVSDFVPVKQTPAIDSLQWRRQPDGVSIFLNTHDPQNNTRYYRWEYTETWEYHSYIKPELGVNNGLIYYQDPSQQTYTCWRSAGSTNILLGSSVNLAQDVISFDSITTVPQNSIKIGVRYSIVVKQYALSQAAYAYWQLLQKNTQQLGSLFDAQPSQLAGNIACTTNPGEVVIGYISAGTVKEQRIFVRNDEVPGWQQEFPGLDCGLMTIDQNGTYYLIYNYSDTAYAPYYFSGSTSLVIAKKFCVDCTQAGGTTSKPAFW